MFCERRRSDLTTACSGRRCASQLMPSVTQTGNGSSQESAHAAGAVPSFLIPQFWSTLRGRKHGNQAEDPGEWRGVPPHPALRQEPGKLTWREILKYGSPAPIGTDLEAFWHRSEIDSGGRMCSTPSKDWPTLLHFSEPLTTLSLAHSGECTIILRCYRWDPSRTAKEIPDCRCR